MLTGTYFIAEEGGLNLYGFVGNMIWGWDELGLWCKKSTVGKIKITSIDAELRHSHKKLFGDNSSTIDLVLDGDDIKNMLLDSGKEKLKKLAIEKILGKTIKKILQSFVEIKSKIKNRLTTRYVYDGFSIKIKGELCCCDHRRYKTYSVSSNKSTSILINLVEYIANSNSRYNRSQFNKIKATVESTFNELEDYTCDDY